MPNLCVVDVVAFVTPRASQIDRVLPDRIRLNIETSNQILRNGRINSGRTFRLVGIVKVNLIETQGAMRSDLGEWALRQEINIIRNNLNADVGVFVAGSIARNGTENYPGIFGVAHNITDQTLIKPWAALVKTGEALAARLTFPHELAHLMDCWHDYQNQGQSNNAFVYSNQTPSGNQLIGTVVASGLLAARIPYFSNPNVTVQHGASTFVPGGSYNNGNGQFYTGNNNKRITETFCLVANQIRVRPINCPDCDYAIAILPNTAACPCSNSTLSLNTEVDEPPTSILWEASNDGITYIVAGTARTLSYQRPCQPSSTRYFRVTATFVNGRQSQAFFSDMADNPPNANYSIQGQCAGSRVGAEPDLNLRIFVNGNTASCITSDQKTPVTIHVYSLLGQALGAYLGPANGARIDLRPWQGQPVFIRCVQGKQTAIQRVQSL